MHRLLQTGVSRVIVSFEVLDVAAVFSSLLVEVVFEFCVYMQREEKQIIELTLDR